MTILFANNASTTVAGSITAASTTVNLAAGTGIFFPQPIAGSGNYFCATFYDQATKTVNEIVHVTNITGDVATIVRGQEGTTPRAWTSGDIFANLVTAGTLNAFVQAGIIAANTEIVYTGIDTSVNPAHIICNTIPVPSAYATGMVFTIKVGAAWPGGTVANNGSIDLQLNGVPAVFAKRTDGSNLIAGNFIANQEYAFLYNGTFFSTTIMPVPETPPQDIFYVRSDSTSTLDSNGIESNSGFANTPQQAFKTIQGAVNTIKSRYISQQTITVQVADGTYNSGWGDDSQYVADWNFIGNVTTPNNVQIVATSTNPATYVPNAPIGTCSFTGQQSKQSVHGFSFQSYSHQVTCGGVLNISNCNFTAPTDGASSVLVSTGYVTLTGTCQYSGAIACASLFFAYLSGQIQVGFHNFFSSQPLTFNIVGTPVVTHSAYATSGGAIVVYDSVCSFSSNTSGLKYNCNSAGGISFASGNTANLPGTLPGIVGAPSATDCGGWQT